MSRSDRRQRRDRELLARQAGLSGVSGFGVVAGVLAAYGAIALLLSVVGGVAAAVGIDTDFTNQQWRQLGAGGGAAVAAVLLLSWLFGGYVAGRMAGRAGALNGLVVFGVGVAIVAIAGGLIGVFADTDRFVDELQDLGVPTTSDQWSDIGTFAGIASVMAMLVGAVLGGSLGERWHRRIFRQAGQPPYARTEVTTHDMPAQDLPVGDDTRVVPLPPDPHTDDDLAEPEPEPEPGVRTMADGTIVTEEDATRPH